MAVDKRFMFIGLALLAVALVGCTLAPQTIANGGSESAQNAQFGSGGTVLSLQQVIIQSSNPAFNSMTWAANVVVNGKGQTIIGSQGSAQPNDNLVAGTSLSTDSKKIDINYKLKSFQCSYGYYDGGQRFLQYYPAPVTNLNYDTGVLGVRVTVDGGTCNFVSPLGTENYKNACRTAGGVVLNCGYNAWQCYMVKFNTLGGIYNLYKPSDRWTVDFSISNGLNNENASLSNSLTRQATTDMVVEWAGSLYSGDSCPAESTASVTYDNGVPRLLDPISGTDAIILTRGKDPNYWRTYDGKSLSELNGGISNENTQMTNVKNQPIQGSFAQYPTTVSSSQVLLDSSSAPFRYPQFQLLVRASWLGIYIPNPTGILSQCAISDMQGGRSGTLSAQVTNTGETGSVLVSASCGYPYVLSESGSKPTQQLAKGQSQLISFNVGAAVVSSSTSGSCTLKTLGAAGETQSTCAPIGTVKPACTLEEVGNYKRVFLPDGTCKLNCSLDPANTPPGYRLDPTTCLFVPSQFCGNGQCEYGQGENKYTCSADCGVCPQGQVAQPDGTCKINCPFGQVLQADGTCQTPGCPSGQEKWNNTCVNVCQAGTTRQADGTCIGGGVDFRTLALVAGGLLVAYLLFKKR